MHKAAYHSVILRSDSDEDSARGMPRQILRSARGLRIAISFLIRGVIIPVGIIFVPNIRRSRSGAYLYTMDLFSRPRTANKGLGLSDNASGAHKDIKLLGPVSSTG